MPLSIVIVTGGRADWGLLAPVAQAIQAEPALSISIIATGQHMGPKGTLGQIKAEGFAVAATVDLALDTAPDDGLAIAAAMGRATSGVAEALVQLKPDMLLVLGDRYEILGAVCAATALRLPVAHIAGGDITEGAMDDAMRHAITKLSHLHFVTNADAADRLMRMGEEPARIVVSGSPGIDRMLASNVMPRAEFFASVGLVPRPKNAVVTFHPVTLEDNSGQQLAEVLAGLDSLGAEVGLIFTGVNLDPGYHALNEAIRAFCQTRPHAVLHDALGSARYTAALKHCDAVIGNSSSGLYEAPSFGTPTVNIGSRQDGRLKATSVHDCAPERGVIAATISKALALDTTGTLNPYGSGGASLIIARRLAGISDPRILLRKRFHNPT